MENDEMVFEEPQAPLELLYIDEFLKSRGFSSIKDLCSLPDDQAKQLMIEACRYASLKLAEVESKAALKKTMRFTD